MSLLTCSRIINVLRKDINLYSSYAGLYRQQHKRVSVSTRKRKDCFFLCQRSCLYLCLRRFSPVCRESGCWQAFTSCYDIVIRNICTCFLQAYQFKKTRLNKNCHKTNPGDKKLGHIFNSEFICTILQENTIFILQMPFLNFKNIYH